MPVEVPPRKNALDELSEEADSFEYKAKGIFNGEFAHHLDRHASQNSKFYNFYVTKDGQPYGDYGRRGALRPADFQQVLRYTERKTVELVQEILSGKIDVSPYRLNRRSPCSYCEYRPVCRFDWQINEYNFLESLNKLQVLQKIGTADG
jgi:ATP-dependent helicase/DNAse subunit B